MTHQGVCGVVVLFNIHETPRECGCSTGVSSILLTIPAVIGRFEIGCRKGREYRHAWAGISERGRNVLEICALVGNRRGSSTRSLNLGQY